MFSLPTNTAGSLIAVTCSLVLGSVFCAEFKESEIHSMELSSIAEDSIDLVARLQLERHRAEARVASTKKWHRQIQKGRSRGMASANQMRLAEKEKQRASIRLATISEACRFLENSLPDVWTEWSRAKSGPLAAQPVLNVPGVTFEVGGHVLFGLETRITRKVLAASKKHVQARIDQNAGVIKASRQTPEDDLSTWLKRIGDGEKFAEALKSRWQFTNQYQEHLDTFARRSLERDRDRIDLALADTSDSIYLPVMSSSVAGVGTGWKHAVPLDEAMLKATLPLALYQSQADGSLQVARIRYVIAKTNLTTQEKLYRQNDCRKIDLQRAERTFKLTRNAVAIATQEQQIKKLEAELIATLCGIDLDSYQSGLDLDQLVLEVAAMDCVTKCRQSPAAFCGVMTSYINFVIAHSEMKEAQAELSYRQDKQKRLTECQYIREAELRSSIFRAEEAAAELTMRQQLMEARFLELNQWVVIQRYQKHQRESGIKLVFGIVPGNSELSVSLAEKRAQLAALHSKNAEIVANGASQKLDTYTRLSQLGSAYPFELRRAGLRSQKADGLLTSQQIEENHDWRSVDAVDAIDRECAGSGAVRRNLEQLPEQSQQQIYSVLAAREKVNDGAVEFFEAERRLKSNRAEGFRRLYQGGYSSVDEVVYSRQSTLLAELELQVALAQESVGHSASQFLDEIARANAYDQEQLQVSPVPVSLTSDQ